MRELLCISGCPPTAACKATVVGPVVALAKMEGIGM